MGVVLLGLNHRTAPVELRERMAFDAASTLSGLEALARRTHGAEAVILSTCNRVEVAAFRDDDATLLDEIEQFLVAFHDLSAGVVAGHLYRLRGREAIEHLFRVASSLDSMVPGEPQILAQVKEAYLRAAEAGYTGKHLNVLLQWAFRVAKRVHTDTDIGRWKVSVSSVAVDLAQKVLGGLADRTVLVLGAGETGKLTLRGLVESGVGRLLVASRTAEHARGIAEQFRGVVVPWEEVRGRIGEADIVISSTASRGFVLGRDDVAAAIASRGGRPLVIIDIAVPRDVHPSVAELEGVRLYDIDDLGEVVAGNIDRREREFEHSLELVEGEVSRFEAWLDRHETEEVIAGLVERAREASRAELEKLWEKMPDVDEDERRQINAAVERIVNRIMHAPLAALKAESQLHDSDDFTRIMRTFFGVDSDEESRGE